VFFVVIRIRIFETLKYFFVKLLICGCISRWQFGLVVNAVGLNQ